MYRSYRKSTYLIAKWVSFSKKNYVKLPQYTCQSGNKPCLRWLPQNPATGMGLVSLTLSLPSNMEARWVFPPVCPEMGYPSHVVGYVTIANHMYLYI